MVRSYQPPKLGKVLDRSSIFFVARSYLLVLNSSLLPRPFLYSTVRCYYSFSSLLDRPFSFYNSSLLVFNSSLLHRPFSFYNSSLLPRPFLFFTKSDVLILVNFFVN